MKDDDLLALYVTRRDAGRVLSALRERRRKLKRGIDKFGDDFDPQLGKNMLDGQDAYERLINQTEQLLGSDRS